VLNTFIVIENLEWIYDSVVFAVMQMYESHRWSNAALITKSFDECGTIHP
jgi:hypothetical protein